MGEKRGRRGEPVPNKANKLSQIILGSVKMPRLIVSKDLSKANIVITKLIVEIEIASISKSIVVIVE